MSFKRRALVATVLVGAAAVTIAAELMTSSATGAGQRQVSFLTWRQVPYGLQSTSLDAADFNGDGVDDLAVLDGDLVVLLLADGHGYFSVPLVHRRGGASAIQLLARDFNGDGKADVAVCYGDGDVWLFLGDGQGGLSNGEAFATGGSPTSMAPTDFDGDGHLDLVVALAGGSITGRAQFMRNDGNAHFAPVGPAAAVGLAPMRIAAGDFDHDGHPDIAVTNFYNRTATVLFGDGKGGLTDSITLSTVAPVAGLQPDLVVPYAPLPLGIAAGDLNGDGLDDLVVGNGVLYVPPAVAGAAASAAATPGSVLEENPLLPYGEAALFMSAGDRAFAPPVFLPVDNHSRDLRIVDANGDGRPDIVAAGLFGVLTMLQRADGTFVRRGSTGAGSGIALTAGDFNHDGQLDFATVYVLTRVNILLGEGGGRLPAPFFIRTQPTPEFSATAQLPVQAVAADLNNDGIQDLVTTTGPAGTIVSFLGLGDGEFAAPIASPVWRETSLFAVADLTGDGVMDIALTTQSPPYLDVFAGDGSGRFALASHIASDRDFGKVVVADFNNDGLPDLVVVARGVSDNFVGADVFLNEGGGRFQRSASLASSEATVDVLVADLDHDGNTDVVLVNGVDLSVFLAEGGGTFGQELPVHTGAGHVTIGTAALADFDEDGFPDLAVGQAVASSGAAGMFWLRGDGHGGFTNPVLLNREHAGLDTASNFVGQAAAAADFNGDGHADIAVMDNDGVTVFQGDGHGGFSRASPFFGLQSTHRGLTVGDFNGDGLPDITTPAEGFAKDGSPAIWMTLLFNTTPPARIVAGDANCDGRVNQADLAALTHRLFSRVYLPACAGADANQDGAITVADLLATAARFGP